MSASDNNLTGPQSQTRPKVIYILKRKITTATTTATTTTTSTNSCGSASYSHNSPAWVNINQVDPTRGLAGELSSNFWQSQVLGSGTEAGGISYNQAGLGLSSPLTPSKTERDAGSKSMLDLLENIKTEEPEDEGGFNPQLDHQSRLADSVKKEPGEFCGENRESAAGSSFMLELLDHLEMKIEAQEDGDITEVESFAKKEPGEFCEENNFKLDLFEDMETEHQEGGGRNHNICPYCQKSFQSPSKLELHIKSHTKTKPFGCEFCTQTFSRNGSLKRHINGVHNGEKHQCHLCTQTFSRNSNLKSHINGVHLGEKHHQCHLCTQTFSRNGDLKRHINVVHNGEKHQCHLCTKTFSDKSALKRHINGVHVEEKKHKCPVCNKSFHRRDYVTRHIKTHDQK